MTLAEYAKSKKLTSVAIAEALEISQPVAWRLMNAKKDAPVDLAIRIEAWSKGKVKATEVNSTLATYANHKRGRAA